MDLSRIDFMLIHDDAKMPTRKHICDAGIDVFSCEVVNIPPHEQRVIHTGVQLVDCPDGVIQVWSKSGNDATFGLHVGAGIIDPNYRGEILVLLKNMSSEWCRVAIGDAIAQLVIVPIMRPFIWQRNFIDDDATERGGTGGIVNARS